MGRAGKIVPKILGRAPEEKEEVKEAQKEDVSFAGGLIIKTIAHKVRAKLGI